MMAALSSKCSRNIECRKIQRRYSWSYHSVLFATAKLWPHLSTWQCKMSRGSCLSRLSEPESHPCSSLAGTITGSVINWTFTPCTTENAGSRYLRWHHGKSNTDTTVFLYFTSGKSSMPGKKSAFKINLTYDFQGKVISIRIYYNTSFDLYKYN